MKSGEKLRKLLSESLIISLLMRLCDSIYEAVSNSSTGKFMSRYTVINEKVKNSFFYRIFGKLNLDGRIIKPVKRFIINITENSLILDFFKRMLDNMLLCQMKTYGVFLLSFGVYTVIIYFLATLAFDVPDPESMNALVGIALALISIPLLAAKRRLSDYLCESRFMSFILFRVIGIRRESIEIDGKIRKRSTMGFIFGMAAGILTYVVSPVWILLGVAGFLGAMTILRIPEFGIVAMILVLPFLPTMVLVAFTAYVTVCYFLKLIRCKRVLKFELCDISVIIFMIMMFLGGVFSVEPSGSIKPALVYVCYMLGYFLTVNLIRTSEWVNRCIGAVIFSMTIVSLYGVYEYFFTDLETIWQDEELFEDISGRVVSTFENPNVLAEYIIMALPFAIAVLMVKGNVISKIAMFAVCICGGACLIFTWSRGAWLGFMIGILLFLLIYSKKSVVLIVLGVFSIPFLPFVLPSSILSRFSSIGNIADTSTSYRVNIWLAVVNMVKDFFLGGIGIGESAFSSVYPEYSLAGIESAPHSHNLYLQITVEIGIFGLLAFIAAMMLFAQSNFSFYRDIRDNEHDRKMLSAAGLCGIVSVLAQGMTDYIWYNYRVFLMFWLMVGLTSSIVRSAGFERTDFCSDGASVDLIYDKN